MNEEKFKCGCGCGYEGSYKEAFNVVFEDLEEQKRERTLVGFAFSSMIRDIMQLKEQSSSINDDNLRIVIESICSDIKKINDRLDKLEGKDNPSVRVCYSNDVKPV